MNCVFTLTSLVVGSLSFLLPVMSSANLSSASSSNLNPPVKIPKKLKPVLDDLSSRFILTCPEEEFDNLDRIVFQIEQAHWFYDDFYREADSQLPSYNLRDFTRLMFYHCPLLRPHADQADTIFSHWKLYKERVPVCGGILLNSDLTKVLLVKGWYSRSSWGFPRGKVNKDEPLEDCAAREVYEETSFNLHEPPPPCPGIKSDWVLQEQHKHQLVTLFVIPMVPEEFPFLPRTRKEISKIKWHYIRDIPHDYSRSNDPNSNGVNPNNFFTIVPFMKYVFHDSLYCICLEEQGNL